MEISNCTRCGLAFEQAKKRHAKCKSCRTTKQTIVGDCVPWQGNYAEDQITPIEDGQPVLPGTRNCGHADCVNPNHIRREKQWPLK